MRFDLRLARAFLALSTVAGGAACRQPRDPVLDLVDALRRAAEDRDAQAVADHLADDFKGSGGADKAEATATLRRYFAGYESVHLAVYDVAVRGRTDGEADVSFRAEFSGSARPAFGLDGFLPPSAAYHFDLRVVRKGNAWKVASAEWKAAEPPASPAG
jgi:hypothetical protein